ncbi:hypothetical protein [Vibrio sp. WXL103]|uniref:hypothetical protein n=1 Tax=unclassified Vibrio TaxID=2614977 RepID=UPI003EC71F79
MAQKLTNDDLNGKEVALVVITTDLEASQKLDAELMEDFTEMGLNVTSITQLNALNRDQARSAMDSVDYGILVGAGVTQEEWQGETVCHSSESTFVGGGGADTFGTTSCDSESGVEVGADVEVHVVNNKTEEEIYTGMYGVSSSQSNSDKRRQLLGLSDTPAEKVAGTIIEDMVIKGLFTPTM